MRTLMEMQADSVEPEKSDFLQPLDSEIQTWMSKAFDMVKVLWCLLFVQSIYHGNWRFPQIP